MHNKKMMPILDKMMNKIVLNKEVVNDGMVWITCTIFLLFYCHEQTVFSITISFKKIFIPYILIIFFPAVGTSSANGLWRGSWGTIKTDTEMCALSL